MAGSFVKARLVGALVVVISAALWLLQPAAAQGPEDWLKSGPKVGEKIPHLLTAVDQNGKKRSFDDLKGDEGLVLMFNRSFDWCIYCKRQAADWNDRLWQVENRDYAVVAVTYDSVKELNRFARRENLGYTLLSDPNSEIIKAFGVLNKRITPGSPAYGIAYPIIFVINKDGVVTARFSQTDYAARPEIDLVLKAIDQQEG